VFVNNALASILGYPAEQLVGKTPVEMFHEAYKSYFGDTSQLFETGIADLHWQVLEFTVPGDDREVWMEGRHSVILWEGASAVLVDLRDITERKRKENELKKERQRLRQENIRLRSAMKERYRFGDIIGRSPAMQEVYELIAQASTTDANVVIYGESGTGKDLVARTIHTMSKRRKHPFVPVNCGSIQETLFESEFFGYRKGAFTGALRDKLGFFDAAHKGTLFLDEVGELPPMMQVKLLRAIEGGGYTPVGDHRVKHADVRIIAATNRNMAKQIKQGMMRQDFYYRINVIPINVPPLRERREDIPLLAEHFLTQYTTTKKQQTLPGRILASLYNHDWPGNIRQLQNVLQRYLTLKRLDFDDAIHHPGDEHFNADLEQDASDLRQAIDEFEKRHIVKILEQNQGHKGKTAAVLKIDTKTLYRKMKKYQIIMP
jgi:PAS domain S-box-containing protein